LPAASARTAPLLRKRAPQKRAAETRELLLAAATEQFASFGFEGVSVRAIESHAGVQRGLVAYHFDTKEALWRQVVDRLFAQLDVRHQRTAETVRDLSPAERLPAFVATFVRFSAEVPALNRLMVQEGKARSWRMDYLVDTHVRRSVEQARALLGIEIGPHGYYALIGSAAFVFSMEYECERLFGVNPRTEAFIHAHARMVAGLIQSFGIATDEDD
jgi:AcrR family transcriptional regulator